MGAEGQGREEQRRRARFALFRPPASLSPEKRLVRKVRHPQASANPEDEVRGCIEPNCLEDLAHSWKSQLPCEIFEGTLMILVRTLPLSLSSRQHS